MARRCGSLNVVAVPAGPSITDARPLCPDCSVPGRKAGAGLKSIFLPAKFIVAGLVDSLVLNYLHFAKFRIESNRAVIYFHLCTCTFILASEAVD